MRIINKKYLLIIMLIGIILISVIVFKPKENIKLGNVILKQEVNNNTFAMYKEEGKSYVPVEGTKFPEAYVLNINESKCIDNNGNEIQDALSYENDEVVLTTNKSSYCYLYFDKSLGLEIKEKTPRGLSLDKARGAMYRFQGQQSEGINNYICFGTSDKEKCIKDTDYYMYRIIGIEAETGRVKVIKKEALDDKVLWWDNYDDDIEFPKSKIYETISGDGFLKNTDYVPAGWEEKIANNTWIYGDMWSYSIVGACQTGEGLYQTETGQKETRWYNYATAETPGAIQATITDENSPYKGNTVYYTEEQRSWKKTFNAKVSLMYLHDYYYSVSDNTNCQINEEKYEECQTGWMHLSQNDAGIPIPSEWTMTRLGWVFGSGRFFGHHVNNLGYTGDSSMNIGHFIRPVFYINASEKLLTGTETGTIENPFIIKS